MLYSRGMSGYKDAQFRNSMWADKAAEMGRIIKQLKEIRYTYLRTRAGKLVCKKSGGRRLLSRQKVLR